MKLQIGEDEYRIEFDHYKDQAETLPEERRRTTCVIKNRSRVPETVAFADAICSLKDNFSKETGRKLALTRALESFPREQRKLFWEAYLNRPRHEYDPFDNLKRLADKAREKKSEGANG